MIHLYTKNNKVIIEENGKNLNYQSLRLSFSKNNGPRILFITFPDLKQRIFSGDNLDIELNFNKN